LIPRILHQTWRDRAVPERWQPLRASWRRHHPRWEHRFWTDADLRRLVADHYPGFLRAYDAYEHPICRVDAARYLLLHRHGGVYVDLDFEALRPIDPLLAAGGVLFGEEPASHRALPIVQRRPVPLRRLVCNAFIASEPAHPFWAHLLARIAARAHERDPLEATGPFLLSESVEAWRGPAAVRVAPASQLYPLDKHEVQAGALRVRGARSRLAREAFAVHHWGGSWIAAFQAHERARRAALAGAAPPISRGSPERI